MCGETIKHAAKVAIRHIRVATRLTAIVLRYNMADNPYMKPNNKAHQHPNDQHVPADTRHTVITELNQQGESKA
jgi:hypothetical protein